MKRKTKNSRKVAPFTGTYKKPRLFSIKLDPDAAVLATCKTFNAAGGAWRNTVVCVYGTGTAGAITASAFGCDIGFRAGAGSASGFISGVICNAIIPNKCN